MTKKSNYMEFIKWLKDSINNLDKKLDEGLNDINEQLRILNSSVNENRIAIVKLIEWKKEHEEKHEKSDRYKKFLIKTFMGSGIVMALILLFLNKLL